ncbi:MAG: histidine phosphatase family protein [Planctomycetes bacterium]|nr:histidine phosphatase family protein [Planctomycetota bacterium]
MKKFTRRELLFASLSAIAIAVVGILLLWNPTAVVILVRHAEKANDGTDNPPLSAAGTARADELARVLEFVDLNAVYATTYQRTQLTATPTAIAKNLTPVLQNDLDQLETALKSSWSTTLVVGHSNTVPDLVNRLAGTSLADLPESEYDHMFVVYRTRWGGRRLVHLQYGANN